MQRDLTTALHKAVLYNELVLRQGLRVKTNGSDTIVNLSVSPVIADSATMPESPLYLVVLEEAPLQIFPKGTAVRPNKTRQRSVSSITDAEECPVDLETRFAALTQELQAKEEFIKAANWELEATNEELQATNEEIQSTNEELQSLNEELATVNMELQSNVLDLSRANNDLNNKFGSEDPYRKP